MTTLGLRVVVLAAEDSAAPAVEDSAVLGWGEVEASPKKVSSRIESITRLCSFIK